METGTLAKWLVKVGDTVNSGDVIAEIETDKATMEVEAVDEGVWPKIVGRRRNRGCCCKRSIARLAEDGEDASSCWLPRRFRHPRWCQPSRRLEPVSASISAPVKAAVPQQVPVTALHQRGRVLATPARWPAGISDSDVDLTALTG